MNNISEDNDLENANAKAVRLFRLHAQSFAVGAALLMLAAIAAQVGWFFFWPALIWGFFLVVHYFYVRSIQVRDDWADEHANTVTNKAYDVSHIEFLRERYTGGTSHNRRDRPTKQRRDIPKKGPKSREE